MSVLKYSKKYGIARVGTIQQHAKIVYRKFIKSQENKKLQKTQKTQKKIKMTFLRAVVAISWTRSISRSTCVECWHHARVIN